MVPRTDRSLPKKRLSPAEMAEINRLYRIIGASEQDLARLRSEQPSSAGAAAPVGPAVRPMSTGIYVAAGALLVMLALALYRVRRSRPAGRDR
jgi:hypothetical protein